MTRNIEGKITFSDLFLGFLLALYGIITSDFLSANSTYGKACAFVVFISCFYVLFAHKFRAAVNYYIALMLASPFIARNTSEFLRDSSVVFESYISTKISLFTLSTWTILGLAVYAILHLGGAIFKLNKAFLRYIFILFFFMSIATLFDVLFYREAVRFSFFKNDIRIFVMLISGVIIGQLYFALSINSRYPFSGLFNMLKVLAIAFGIKTAYFVVSDFVTGNIVFNFGTQPYFFIPLFCCFVFFSFNHSRLLDWVILILTSLLGAFSISRGNIALLFVCFFMYFISFNSLKAWRKKILLSLSFPVIVAILGVLAANLLTPKTYQFLSYKIEFFTKEIFQSKEDDVEINESASIRIYEFQNIKAEAVALRYPVFIGKGFGSYFKFENVPIPYKLMPWDYSNTQLLLREYYRPHTFLNYSFLKGGLLFLSFFLFSFFFFWTKAKAITASYTDQSVKFLALYSFFFSPVIFMLFWIPEYVFIWGFLSSFLMIFSRAKRKIND
jgi:hypothetical protein